VQHIYSSIRGTCDFGPSETFLFREINQKASRIFAVFGYEEIILPVLEQKGLFARGVGQNTDIVDKQMFKIEDKDIVLRPEGTAQVIRYYIQNSLHRQGDIHKFFYQGPMFRGERPQKGRLRQFHHIGAEAIGSDSFYLDAEMIILLLRILENVGVKEKELSINTLGCEDDKIKFSNYLKDKLKKYAGGLCDDCKRRVQKNPLRVLDCKNEQCKNLVRTLDLGESQVCVSCREQFKNLLSFLEDLGVQYTHVPRLVRGLDYYTNTVFEITSSKLGSKDALGAGGRYNNLMKSLGGPDIPAIGFALGLERILLVLEATKPNPVIDIFVAASGSLLRAGFGILETLRKAGFLCDFDYCQKSLKGQLRLAQKKKARFVVIVAQEEWDKNLVVLKDMQKGQQREVKADELLSILKESLSADARQ
jgi:histidyl-tRNA synthetase